MSILEDNATFLADMGPRERYHGVTGRLDPNGNVEPDPTLGLDTGYTWARLDGERTAIAVYNVRVTNQRPNIPVIIEALDSGELQIIGIDPKPAIYTYGDFAPSLNMPDKPPEQEKSSVFHKRIGDLRLRLSSTGGLVLHVNKGVYRKVDGTLEYFDGADIDTTASVPGVVDTKRVVLIGIDSTNALVQSTATAVTTGNAPTESPFFTTDDIVIAANAASSSVSWIWGFGLLNGETTIPNVDRFVDLRPIIYAAGSTIQATLATTDATVTPLISHVVAQLTAVTIAGRIVASKTDYTASYGASFRVTFRRPSGGNVALVGTGWLEQEDDSAGTPAVTFSFNTGTQVGIVNFAGIAAENWTIKAWYTVITA